MGFAQNLPPDGPTNSTSDLPVLPCAADCSADRSASDSMPALVDPDSGWESDSEPEFSVR
jgi:hypothetical protein